MIIIIIVVIIIIIMIMLLIIVKEMREAFRSITRAYYRGATGAQQNPL